MTKGRVDLSKATAAPQVKVAAPTYKRVLKGTALTVDCQVSTIIHHICTFNIESLCKMIDFLAQFTGQPMPRVKWTHMSPKGDLKVLEEGITALKEKTPEEKDKKEEEEEAEGPVITSRLTIDNINGKDAGNDHYQNNTL